MTYPIRTLAPGEKISEPGFWNIPMHVHHGQPCVGPSVTSGVLRRMELATPADVWAKHLLNPNRWPDEDKTALRLGRAMAAMVEGGVEELARHFLVLPADKPRQPTEAQIAAYDAGKGTEAGIRSVEFWRAIAADPRDPLTDAEQEMILNMGRVLLEDPAACAVMSGLPEISMVWQDEITGLWVLSRPDTVSFDGTVSDYKKINTQGRPFNHRVVDDRITQFGYDMQMALACEGFEQLTREWPGIAAIVAQWDAVPHHVIPREISEEDLRFGQFRNRRALNRFAECLESGDWPGPGADTGAYQRPEWQRLKLLDEMQTAGTAP
jgi:hypothetical protein